MPDVIETNKAEYVASLADGPAIETFETTTDAAVEQEDAAVQSGNLAASQSWGSYAAASSPSSRWDPGLVTAKVQKVGTPTAKKIKFTSYHYRNGTTAKPANSGQYGMEFEVNVWGTHYDSRYIRCDGPCISAWHCQGSTPDNYLLAKKSGWSFTIYMKPNYVGSTSYNVGLLGAYADINDLWDPCNTNSIAIGLRYPGKISPASALDPSRRLYVTVVAPKGQDDSNKVSAQVQAVEGASCVTFPSMTLTDCMGANPAKPFFGYPDDRVRPVLALSRGWIAPNLCWQSTSYGRGPTSTTSKTLPCVVNPW